MKRLISILFLTILLAPALVTFIWLEMEKASIKKEIKHKIIEGIADDELVLLAFTSDEAETLLQWEHAKEFEFENQMYDVIKTEQRGDSVFYTCWWDNKETHLNKRLNELVSEAFGNDPEQKNKRENLISFYKVLFCKPLVSVSLLLPPLKNAPFKRQFFFYSAPALQVLVPPPSFC